MPLAGSYGQARIQVEQLVERCGRNLAAATVPADKELYQRQIDTLVYNPYGPTGEETTIVEGQGYGS